MKPEIVERKLPDTPSGLPPRVWDVRDEYGNTTAEIYDERVVRLLQDAMVVSSFIENCTATESRQESKSEESDILKRTIHVAMGLCTESGEFMDSVKKFFFYDQPLDWENLDEEVFDHLWYLAVYMAVRGTTFPTIMAKGIRKLRARYPNGYSHADAQTRDYDKERNAANWETSDVGTESEEK